MAAPLAEIDVLCKLGPGGCGSAGVFGLEEGLEPTVSPPRDSRLCASQQCLQTPSYHCSQTYWDVADAMLMCGPHVYCTFRLWAMQLSASRRKDSTRQLRLRAQSEGRNLACVVLEGKRWYGTRSASDRTDDATRGCGMLSCLLLRPPVARAAPAADPDRSALILAVFCMSSEQAGCISVKLALGSRTIFRGWVHVDITRTHDAHRNSSDRFAATGSWRVPRVTPNPPHPKSSHFVWRQLSLVFCSFKPYLRSQPIQTGAQIAASGPLRRLRPQRRLTAGPRRQQGAGPPTAQFRCACW